RRAVGPLRLSPIDARSVLPVPERGERRRGAAHVARPGDERWEVLLIIADVTSEHHHVRALARQDLERRVRGGRYAPTQVHVGEARDSHALDPRWQPRHGDHVPGDIDRGRFYKEGVP